MFYTNDLISELSGHHSALDCVSHSDLTYTKGHFHLNWELMQGSVLMTDYSCKKFRFCVEDNLLCLRILNDSTFFKERNIAKNDYSSVVVWHVHVVLFGAELKSLILIQLHLAQADLVDRTVRLCMSLFPRDPMAFETSIDTINMHIRTMYVSGSLIWVYTYRQQNALCQQEV